MTNRIFFIVIVLVSCVGCDQSSKAVAETYLTETQMWSFWGDTIRLQLAYNHGAFLSLGSALPEAWRAGFFSVGVGLMLAGGIGNLVDRIAYGYVIDFMNVGIGSLRTGIFNFADIAVTLGVLLLIIKAMPFSKQEK